MSIIIINGSPRKSGRTTKLTKFMANTYHMELVDLSEVILPLFNGTEEQEQSFLIKNLMSKLEQAEGIIIATPEYHAAVSGALKNMLDFLGSAQFKDKPVSIIAVAGGGKGGINALNNARIMLRGLYANVLSKQMVIDPTDFNESENVLNEEPMKRLDEIVEQLQRFVAIGKQL